MIALGGGLLLGGVTLVLVPGGAENASAAEAAMAVFVGALFFMLADKIIETRKGRMAESTAMVMDLVPESTALGAAFAMSYQEGILLAFLIGLQNIPEGFNSFRELRELRIVPRRAFVFLLSFAILSPLAAVTGVVLLSGHPVGTSWFLLFSAGGILYILLHDIAPLAHEDGHWLPTLAGVVGFMLALVSEMLV